MSDVRYAWLGHRATPVPVPQGTPGGHVFTSEAAAVFGPSRPQPGKYRGAVLAHGLGAVAFDFISRAFDQAGDMSSIQWALADRRFVCACPDLGGTETFGNENGWTAVKNAVEQLVALWGAKAGKQTVIGASQGGATVGNLVLRHPDLVHQVVFVITPFDMRDVHEDDALGAADNIEACYADYPGGWEAAMPTHNLLDRAEDFAAADVPLHVYSVLSDGVCEWWAAVEFTHRVNAEAGFELARLTDVDGIVGREAPADDLGGIGEYHYVVTGTEQLLYGPKTAEGWGDPEVLTSRVFVAPSEPVAYPPPFTPTAEPGDYAIIPYTTIVDDFSTDTIANYTFDVGAGTLSVSGGQLVPSSAVAKRLYHSAYGYRYRDSQQILKFTTGASVATYEVLLRLKRQASNTYIMAGVTPGAGVAFYTVINGVTTLIANTSAPLVANTTYWVRARIEGNVVTVELFTSEPTPMGAPSVTVSATLTGAGLATFGADQDGHAGLRFGTQATDWRYDDFRIEPVARRLYGPATSMGPGVPVSFPSTEKPLAPAAPRAINPTRGVNGHSGNYLHATALVDELLPLGAL